jgi:hypothetical protein
MLALRLSEDIESRLDKLAQATGAPKAFTLARPFLTIWQIWKIFISQKNELPKLAIAKAKAKHPA